MKRIATALLLAGALIGAPPSVTPSAAEVDFHIGIGIPAPPAVVFERRPRVVVVPRTDIYYVPEVTDYDMYRVGRYWYINQEGYWYRSRSYRGPFQVVERRRLPRAFRSVPAQYRRFPHEPHPRQRSYDNDDRRDWRDRRDRDRRDWRY